MTSRIAPGAGDLRWPADPEARPGDLLPLTTDPTSVDVPEEGMTSPAGDSPLGVTKTPVTDEAAPSMASSLRLQEQSLSWFSGAGDLLERLFGSKKSEPAPLPSATSTSIVPTLPPSSSLSDVGPTVAAALDAGDSDEALRMLNGKSMSGMLQEVDLLSAAQRQTLHQALGEGTFASLDKSFPPFGFGRADRVDAPRIGYALDVVEHHRLPPTNFGDLQATGQVKEAADFLAERVFLPVAQGANRNAAPHISRILVALQEQGVINPNHIAYVLATAQHESGTGKAMTEFASGKQYEGRAALGNTEAGDGPRFKGRGYVQLTGRKNYEKYGRHFQVDLVNQPELATDPNLAAKILADGMQKGGYTGKKLSQFDQSDGSFDFVNARKIVNGDTNRPSKPRDATSEPMGIHIAAIARRYREKMNVALSG